MEYLSDKSSVAKMDKNLEKISPFELKNRLIEMADECRQRKPQLDCHRSS